MRGARVTKTALWYTYYSTVISFHVANEHLANLHQPTSIAKSIVFSNGDTSTSVGRYDFDRGSPILLSGSMVRAVTDTIRRHRIHRIPLSRGNKTLWWCGGGGACRIQKRTAGLKNTHTMRIIYTFHDVTLAPSFEADPEPTRRLPERIVDKRL